VPWESTNTTYLRNKNEALDPTGSWLPEPIPGFCSMKRLGVFLAPLEGVLVRRRSFLCMQFVGFSQQFAGTHLYSWVERGTVRVKCLVQEHNTVSPARARTRIGPLAPGTSALTLRPLRKQTAKLALPVSLCLRVTFASGSSCGEALRKNGLQLNKKAGITNTVRCNDW